MWGTLAKAPGRRKSVLGKEDDNETSPSLALGPARLQGGKGLEELEKRVAGGGNSQGKGPGMRKQVVWWTGNDEVGKADRVSRQGLMADEHRPHGSVLGREATKSGAFWNFGKMADVHEARARGEAGGREEATAISR